MTTHVIISLDTWGPHDDNAILSLAGVKADISRENGELDAFYSVVSLRSCYVYGLTLDPDTITRWLQPDRPELVRQALVGDYHDLPIAVDGLFTWYGVDPLPTWCVSTVGGNAANQLQHACKKLGQELPWDRMQLRDYSTLATIVPELPTPDNHNSHNTSLDYARHVAKNLWFLYQYLEN